MKSVVDPCQTFPHLLPSHPPHSFIQAHRGAAADVRGVVQRGRREGLLAAAPGRLGRVRRHRRHPPRPRALRRQRKSHGNASYSVSVLHQVIFLLMYGT